ncbi:MAG TPA: hypothetical protein VFQ83_05435 [Candidatus Udaeobacter sp.]|jgi:hypothetical protein|nr:hypothetical protein [Candidatus Udaeobacter sp.]
MKRGKARADMLLRQVHALLGNGFTAVIYARRSHDYVTSHEHPDWEIAFAHAILANAAYAAKKTSPHSRYYATAKSGRGDRRCRRKRHFSSPRSIKYQYIEMSERPNQAMEVE